MKSVYWLVVVALLLIALLAGCQRHYPPAPKYRGFLLAEQGPLSGKTAAANALRAFVGIAV